MKYQVILEADDGHSAADSAPTDRDVFSLCVLAFRECQGVRVVSAEPLPDATIGVGQLSAVPSPPSSASDDAVVAITTEDGLTITVTGRTRSAALSDSITSLLDGLGAARMRAPFGEPPAQPA